MNCGASGKNNEERSAHKQFAGSSNWLFRDSEPEAKPATPKGLALDGF